MCGKGGVGSVALGVRCVVVVDIGSGSSPLLVDGIVVLGVGQTERVCVAVTEAMVAMVAMACWVSLVAMNKV
jgi:hypothetical protein